MSTHMHVQNTIKEREKKKTKKRSSYRNVSQETDKMDISYLLMSVVYNYYAAIILFYYLFNLQNTIAAFLFLTGVCALAL